MELVTGLPADQLEDQIFRAHRSTDVGHRALAFYLWELHERRLYQKLGFSSAIDFAVRRLSMSKSQAYHLMAAGRELLELPKIDTAFREGTLPWSKVVCLLQVAMPDTEDVWLEKAKELSCRELRVLVARSEKGDKPKQEGKGLPVTRYVVNVQLSSLGYQEWEKAWEKLSDHLGVRLTEAEALRHMARMVLSNHLGRTSMMQSIYKVVVESPDVWKKEDPELEAAISDGATPPGMRLRVLFRDGHACRSCGSRHNLQVHHVIWRSRGGKTTVDNLIALCSRCHGLVHEGLLRIEKEDGGFYRGAPPVNGV